MFGKWLIKFITPKPFIYRSFPGQNAFKEAQFIYNRISLLLSEYANNEKKFLPHITIARVRNVNPIPDISLLPIEEGMLPIDELCLFKSILTREGSIYERIWCNEFY